MFCRFKVEGRYKSGPSFQLKTNVSYFFFLLFFLCSFLPFFSQPPPDRCNQPTTKQFELPKSGSTTTNKRQKSGGSLLGSLPFFGSMTRQNSGETDLEGEWEVYYLVCM